MGLGPSTKALQVRRAPKKRQEVAAVCYRIRKRGVEFLLVQTRGGRWIFPKGGAEPGLTHAQSAALEAFEEAGVHGRMEEIPFARYFRKPGNPDQAEPGVTAHLCEVSSLEPPQESKRNPTWFAAEKAKQRLREDRTPEFGAELARVVDRALARIQRLRDSAGDTAGRLYPNRLSANRLHADHLHKDALQKVQFEAFDEGRLRDHLADAALARYLLRQRYARSSAAIELSGQAHGRRVSQSSAAADVGRQVLRLGAGIVSETARNITAIDSKRSAVLPKVGKLVR
jgi:8-oxo-dGTP pyrophosphatase MutT (NUDIX family)